jgi:hypothetical protein
MAQQFQNEAQDAAINTLNGTQVIGEIPDHQQHAVLQHPNGSELYQSQALHASQGYISLFLFSW